MKGTRSRYLSIPFAPLLMIHDNAVPHSRRDFLGRLVAISSVLVLAPSADAAASQAKTAPIRDIVVYKDPNCGCCTEWIKHIRSAGFVVKVNDMTDMSTVKRSLGVPESLESCHTARVGRYSIEGHVPADLIIRLLNEQPTARGLAVPGMPVGSPGMEMGGRKDKYDIILFEASGKTRVYASR